MKEKILVIRFSSFGDIYHCLGAVSKIKDEYEIDWITHQHFSSVVMIGKGINVISYDKRSGIVGLIKLGWALRKNKYHYIYDAHKNIRSAILKLILRPNFPFPKVFVRSKERIKRILLFKLGINMFPVPYIVRETFVTPIKSLVDEQKKVDLSLVVPTNIGDMFLKEKVVTLVPSAAWPLKMWPIKHWRRLIEVLDDYEFVILGGPEDSFLRELEGERVTNMAGKLSLMESCAAIKASKVVVSADTGLLHVSDLFNKRTIALMGPTAFGGCSSKNVNMVGVDLSCRPCTKDGRGRCKQDVYQKCMVDIMPDGIARLIRPHQD